MDEWIDKDEDPLAIAIPLVSPKHSMEMEVDPLRDV